MQPSFVRRFTSCALLCALFAVAAVAQPRRAMTFDDLMAVRRVADAQISPDGKQVAYVVNAVSKEANRGKRSVWIVPTAGGEAREFITSEKNDDTPRWSADGSRIAFLSTRDGAPQIYVANADGSNARKVTSVPEGVAEFIWSPDGKLFAFTTAVYPECQDLKCVEERSRKADESKVKAVIADRLLFRHWDTFQRGKRSHLFVVSSEGGEPKDLTPGDYDVPPFSLGDPTAFAFSPDSKEIAFARNTDKVEAISTNNDLFIVPVTGGEAKRITGNNTGSDTTPRYSPDGRYIAYRSQARNGYEADRFRLMLYDRQAGTSRELPVGLDRWVSDLAWNLSRRWIVFAAEDRGREVLWRVDLSDGKVKQFLSTDLSLSGLSSSADGRTWAFTGSNLVWPAEVFVAGEAEIVKQASKGLPWPAPMAKLTHMNASLMDQIDRNETEEFEFTGALKAKVHGFIVKPPQFDQSKKYPMVLLIHGGPQGAWLDSWGYRWNPQMWAARGYVTVLLNPHGSTGYGQAFTEQISGDWGGAVYEDLMKGVDHVVKLGYVDASRIGAAGGSYGGYMVNWMLGHTDRFKAFVSHAGVYNLTSMYGVTEELWFAEWEFKGNPWDNPQLYAKWSPHLYAKNFKTPTLVVHGELDYRVPVGEGLQLFTTLQRRGVPSKLLYYPDEGHWILKPQNSELWYKTVLDWFDQWLKPGGATASR
jgi:dipeptidyl aminopeptidase/acylaminoacyl peptidase